MKTRKDATCVAEKTSIPRFIKIKELPQTKASAARIIQGRKRDEEFMIFKEKPNIAEKQFKSVKIAVQINYFVNLSAMTQIKSNIKVEGMTCGHCKKAVENILKEEVGVLQAEVFLEKAEADVTFDDSQTSLQALAKAINDSGIYKAISNE
jgi:copper chaperone